MNLATKYLMLVVGCSSLPAFAIEDMEVAKCAADTNAITRLECFDKLASAHSLAPKTVDTTTPDKGRWITYSKIDPLNDKNEYYAAIPASSGKGTHGEPVSLVLACIGTTRYMHINWQSFLGSDKVKVTYRFGKDPAKTELWEISNDSKATFYPWSLLGILKQLEKTSTFAASLTPYKENAITAIFDISGAHEAFKDLQKNCQW